MTDWNSWAQRKLSRGGHAPESAPAPPAAQPQVAPTSLPLPAPGYAWAMHPEYGPIMVPLQPAFPSPPRQPQGVTPFVPQPVRYASTPHMAGAFTTSAPVTTSTLVKPGNRDTYAELLATIPDLVPPSGYDSMAGVPDPSVVQELAGMPEYRTVGEGGNPNTSAFAYPVAGRGAPSSSAMPLGNGVPQGAEPPAGDKPGAG